MLYKAEKDILSLQTGSVALGSTATWKISRQPRRLEGLRVRITATTDGAAATASKITARFGIAAIVKQLRLKVNDRIGNRNAVAMPGFCLLSYLTNVDVKLGRSTQQAMPAGLVVSTAYTFTIYVPLRHPQIGEPYGNVLALPLDNANLNEDPSVEIDFETSANLLSAGAISSVTAAVQPVYRDVPQSVPYIPTELQTVVWDPTTTSNVPFEFPNVGVLSGFLVQAADRTTFATTRALATGGQYRLEYGRQVLLKTDDLFLEDANDASRISYPTGSSIVGNQPTNEAFFDFVTEETGQDAYSINSVINLDSATLAGDKLRLFFNDLVDSSTTLWITTHKFLPRSLAELGALSVGI
jgi:hypothetical protein